MMKLGGMAIVSAVFITGIVSIAYFFFSGITSVKYEDNAILAGEEKELESEINVEPKFVATRIETPEQVKGVYMTSCVAATPSLRNKLVRLIEETELNSVIVDVKDYSGTISFKTTNPELSIVRGDGCVVADMVDFISLLHSKGIYTIARITVFQDPLYAKARPDQAVLRASDGGVWRDKKGLSFVDVNSKPFWEYIVAIANESYDMGFDELNFDYIRYPSDGNLSDIAFPASGVKTKADALQGFFSYLYENVRAGENKPVISADLFGYTTTNTDDLGIGQILERALPYFDYVMPMVYPSHYNPGFIGIKNPNTDPYKIVNYSMESAVKRARMLAGANDSTGTTTEEIFLKKLSNSGHGNISTTQLRPWLQDFDYPTAYTPDMVTAQIQAVYDAGLTSWILWDPTNTYTPSILEIN